MESNMRFGGLSVERISPEKRAKCPPKSLEVANKKRTLAARVATQKKILILDDDAQFLELCQELLGTLAAAPEVRTASSGAHAIALLEAEPHSILLTDLRMPNMDGFQVLAIVRRRFPALRTVVMSGLANDEYRNRAYAMGIDLYLEKPKTAQEIKLFVDCIESQLAREESGGFRGVQSKTLTDIVQMESLSQASVTLKFTNGPFVGKIWLNNGDLIDAELGELTGEDAFKKIISWKSGTFESLPAEPTRERRIMNSVQGLLLDSAQMLDEMAAGEVPGSGGEKATAASPLAELSRHPGVEFVVTTALTPGAKFEHFGCDTPEKTAAWAARTAERFHQFGEKIRAGTLQQLVTTGSQRGAGLALHGERVLCVGFARGRTSGQIHETLKKMAAQWAS
jgi:CheY-like chemotaxis protein